MKSTREYNSEDLYKLLIIALRHPEGGHGGESFWCTMITKYGNRFFRGRSAGSLRDKWRKVLKERGFELKLYKKELEKDLTEEKIRAIKAEINGFVPPTQNVEAGEEDEKFRVPNREDFIASLQKKLNEDIHKEEILYGKSSNKQKTAFEQIIASDSENDENMNDIETDNRPNDIDLAELMPNLQDKQIQKIAESLDKTYESGEELEKILKDREDDIKNLVFVHELDSGKITLKNISQTEIPEESKSFLEMNKKLEELSEKYTTDFSELIKLLAQVSGDYNDLEKYLQGEQIPLWTEFEDTVLQHPENVSMYKQLEIIKGKDLIKKRKEYLQLDK